MGQTEVADGGHRFSRGQDSLALGPGCEPAAPLPLAPLWQGRGEATPQDDIQLK